MKHVILKKTLYTCLNVKRLTNMNREFKEKEIITKNKEGDFANIPKESTRIRNAICKIPKGNYQKTCKRK